jgi:hypothetical protein
MLLLSRCRSCLILPVYGPGNKDACHPARWRHVKTHRLLYLLRPFAPMPGRSLLPLLIPEIAGSVSSEAQMILEEIVTAFQAISSSQASSRFSLSEADEVGKLNTISHCLESMWLSFTRSRAFPDAPRDDHLISSIMRSPDVEVMRDINSYLFGEIARMFPRMADTPKAAALLRCFAALIRVLEQVDENAHEECRSIARSMLPVTQSSVNSNVLSSISSAFASILFTCVSSNETILEELYSAGYFTLFLSRLSRLCRTLPTSTKFNTPADKRAALEAASWAHVELESLLIMCDVLSDHVQAPDAASLLLRSSSSTVVSTSASSDSSMPSSAASVIMSSSSLSSSSSSSAAAASASLPPDLDALSVCFTFCAFEDREIAYLAVRILQSIVRFPRVSTAFMDRRGPDIILPLALPQPFAASTGNTGNTWTFFTGPFCDLMLKLVFLH